MRIASVTILLASAVLLTGCVPTAFEGQEIPRTEWTLGPDGKKSPKPIVPNADTSPSEVEVVRSTLQAHMDQLLNPEGEKDSQLAKESKVLVELALEAQEQQILGDQMPEDFEAKMRKAVSEDKSLMTHYHVGDASVAQIAEPLIWAAAIHQGNGKIRTHVPLSAVTIRGDKATVTGSKFMWDFHVNGKWERSTSRISEFPTFYLVQRDGTWKIDVVEQHDELMRIVKDVLPDLGIPGV